MSSNIHHFDIDIAKKYGVNLAIFLNNIAYWTEKNIANNKHDYDGSFWTYNTQHALTILFPYWSRKNIRTVIEYCIKENLLIIGNYNKSQYDRTSWYALTEKGLSLFPRLQEIKNFNKINIGPNRPMERPKPANGLVQTGQPIPDIKPDLKQDNKQELYRSSKNDEPSSFDLFWKKYPRKQKKKRVNQIWVNKKLDNISDKIMQSIDFRLNNDWKCKDLQFIPLPDSYLNQERWNDVVDANLGLQQESSERKSTELKSTVKEYGPGHPTWEANREWELKNANRQSNRNSSDCDARGNGVRKAEDYLF